MGSTVGLALALELACAHLTALARALALALEIALALEFALTLALALTQALRGGDSLPPCWDHNPSPQFRWDPDPGAKKNRRVRPGLRQKYMDPSADPSDEIL